MLEEKLQFVEFFWGWVSQNYKMYSTLYCMSLVGRKSCDHDQISALVYAVIKFALLHSAPEAQLVAKMFQGPNTPRIVADLERFYRNMSARNFCMFLS
jgi:23S rRNA U2552 (ribose-2'-O)-methylase RlmE/FtsJ